MKGFWSWKVRWRSFRRTVLALSLLVVVPFSIWRVHLAYQIQKRFQAIRAAGLPVSGQELNAWYSHVPDSENAAVLMAEAFKLRRSFPDYGSNEDACPNLRGREKGTADAMNLAAEYVKMNSLALAKASEAVQRPSCRYAIDFTEPVPSMRHLAELKGLAFTAASRALLAAKAGNSNDCVKDILLILQLAGTLRSEPDPLSQEVRDAIIGITELTLERAMNWVEFDGDSLRRLTFAFADALNPNSLYLMFVGERVWMIRFYQMGELDSLQRCFFHINGAFERYLPFYLDTMATNFTLAESGPPMSLRIVKSSADLYDRHAANEWKVKGQPVLGHFANRDADAKASVRLALTALAVEQYRLAQHKVPEKLGDLTPQFLREVPADPFDGAPLRYRALTNGYVIYSVSWDGQDDGGKERSRPPFVWENHTNLDLGDGVYAARYGRRTNSSNSMDAPYTARYGPSRRTNGIPDTNVYAPRSGLQISSRSASISSRDSSFDITFRVER